MKRPSLTPADEAFVAAYDGNALATMRRVRPALSDAAARKAAKRIMKRLDILEAIKKRELREHRPAILDRRARQEFWSSVTQDEKQDMAHRLKASELLGKSEADFTENLKLSGGLSMEQSAVLAMRKRRGAS